MSAPVQWQQDQNGNYFYWKHDEGCYVYYPSGNRWNPTTQTLTGPPPQQWVTPRGEPPQPVSSNITSESGPRYPSPSDNRQYTTAHPRHGSFSSGGSSSHVPRSQYGSPQAQQSASSHDGGQGPWQATLVNSQGRTPTHGTPLGNQPGNVPIGSTNPSNVQFTTPNQGLGHTQPGYLPTHRDWQPGSSVPSATGSHPTAPGPSTQGTVKAIHRAIQETPGDYEQLDPRYKKRTKKWFKHGRVFKMHWSQPMDDEGKTVVTKTKEALPKALEKDLPKAVVRDRRFGQYIYSKIRWFIVVKEGEEKCLCVPIVTYKGQGVKKDVSKDEHAIVHTTKEPPAPDPEEEPDRGEKPMRTPIRVTPDEKGDQFSKMSRIDYGRVYTVEQNVKAMAFGNVHPDSIKDLSFDFLNVFMGEQGYKDWRKKQKQQQTDEDADDSEESDEANVDDGHDDSDGDDNGDGNDDSDSDDSDDVIEEPSNQRGARRGLPPVAQAPVPAQAPAPTSTTATAGRRGRGRGSGAPGKAPARKK